MFSLSEIIFSRVNFNSYCLSSLAVSRKILFKCKYFLTKSYIAPNPFSVLISLTFYIYLYMIIFLWLSGNIVRFIVCQISDEMKAFLISIWTSMRFMHLDVSFFLIPIYQCALTHFYFLLMCCNYLFKKNIVKTSFRIIAYFILTDSAKCM